MSEPQPTPEFRRGQIHITFDPCARCGEKHRRIVCGKFTKPCDGYTHYSTCPTTGEPLLVKVTHEGDEWAPILDPNSKAGELGAKLVRKGIVGRECINWDFVPLRGAMQCPGKIVKDGEVFRCSFCRTVYKEGN